MLLITGHSLGGAVAKLVAVRLMAYPDLIDITASTTTTTTKPDHVPPPLLRCAVFGAPLVGDKQLVDGVSRRGHFPAFLTVVNADDIVPRLLLCSAITTLSRVTTPPPPPKEGAPLFPAPKEGAGIGVPTC